MTESRATYNNHQPPELAAVDRAPWTKQHARLVELVRRVAAERDALAAEADPDALTICYMLGKADGRNP